jgi:transcriptional regulator with XRE-family HTH domain
MPLPLTQRKGLVGGPNSRDTRNMKLRALREHLGISLCEAARAIGLGKATLSCIERQIQLPSVATAMAIDEWAKSAWPGRASGKPPKIDWSWTSRRRGKAR